ncbi:MAG: sialidase family protein, partial [Candidatus Omnitrophica bacterium]|nr:sialidase family protein [Candidatus Omnitrophota bacterium]
SIVVKVDTRSSSHIALSTDKGKTWDKLLSTGSLFPGTNEVITDFGAPSIYADTIVVYANTKSGSLYLTLSLDKGKSWSKLLSQGSNFPGTDEEITNFRAPSIYADTIVVGVETKLGLHLTLIESISSRVDAQTTNPTPQSAVVNSRLGASLVTAGYAKPIEMKDPMLDFTPLDEALKMLKANFPQLSLAQEDERFAGYAWGVIPSGAALYELGGNYATLIDQKLRQVFTQNPQAAKLLLYLFSVHETTHFILELSGKPKDINSEIAAELATIEAYAKLTLKEKNKVREFSNQLPNPKRYTEVLNLYGEIIKANLSQDDTITRLKEFILGYPEPNLTPDRFNPQVIKEYLKSQLELTLIPSQQPKELGKVIKLFSMGGNLPRTDAKITNFGVPAIYADTIVTWVQCLTLTTNKGKSWRKLFSTGNNFPGTKEKIVVFGSPAIYADTIVVEIVPCPGPCYLALSTNKGKSWSKLFSTGNLLPGTNEKITKFGAPAIYADTIAVWVKTKSDSHLALSLDKGKSWSKLLSQGSLFPGTNEEIVRCGNPAIYADTIVIEVQTKSGWHLALSLDKGKSWRKLFSTGNNFPGTKEKITNFEAPAIYADTIVVRVQIKSSWRLGLSTDKGKSWTKLNKLPGTKEKITNFGVPAIYADTIVVWIEIDSVWHLVRFNLNDAQVVNSTPQSAVVNSRLGASLVTAGYAKPIEMKDPMLDFAPLDEALKMLKANFPQLSLAQEDERFAGYAWGVIPSGAALYELGGNYAALINEKLRQVFTQNPEAAKLLLYLLSVHETTHFILELNGKPKDINSEIAAELATIEAYARLTEEERAQLKAIFATLEQDTQLKDRFLPVVNLYDKIISSKLNLKQRISSLKTFILGYPQGPDPSLKPEEHNLKTILTYLKVLRQPKPKVTIKPKGEIKEEELCYRQLVVAVVKKDISALSQIPNIAECIRKNAEPIVSSYSDPKHRLAELKPGDIVCVDYLTFLELWKITGTLKDSGFIGVRTCFHIKIDPQKVKDNYDCYVSDISNSNPVYRLLTAEQARQLLENENDSAKVYQEFLRCVIGKNVDGLTRIVKKWRSRGEGEVARIIKANARIVNTFVLFEKDIVCEVSDQDTFIIYVVEQRNISILKSAILHRLYQYSVKKGEVELTGGNVNGDRINRIYCLLSSRDAEKLKETEASINSPLGAEAGFSILPVKFGEAVVKFLLVPLQRILKRMLFFLPWLVGDRFLFATGRRMSTAAADINFPDSPLACGVGVYGENRKLTEEAKNKVEGVLKYDNQIYNYAKLPNELRERIGQYNELLPILGKEDICIVIPDSDIHNNSPPFLWHEYDEKSNKITKFIISYARDNKIYLPFSLTRLLKNSPSLLQAIIDFERNNLKEGKEDLQRAEDLSNMIKLLLSSEDWIYEHNTAYGSCKTLYLDQIFVDTGIIKEIKEKLEDKDINWTAPIGETGFGKSVTVNRMYKEIIGTKEYFPIIIDASGDEFLKGNISIETIRRLGGLLRKDNKQLVIFIDTLDYPISQGNTSLVSSYIEALTRNGIKVVSFCRPNEWDKVKSYTRGEIPVNTIKIKGFRDHKKQALHNYIAVYRPDIANDEVRINEEVKKLMDNNLFMFLCESPLFMAMTFVVYSPDQIPPDISIKKLYDKFWEVKVAGSRILEGEENKRICEYKEALAIFIAWLQKAFEDLKSEGVIKVSKDNIVEFFHQTMFEYAVAKAILSHTIQDPSGKNKIKEVVNMLLKDENVHLYLPIIEQMALSGETDKDLKIYILEQLVCHNDITVKSLAIKIYAGLDAQEDLSAERRIIDALVKDQPLTNYLMDQLGEMFLKGKEEETLEILHFLDEDHTKQVLHVYRKAIEKGYQDLDKLVDYALKAIGDPSVGVKLSALEVISAAIDKGYQDLNKLVGYALKAAEDKGYGISVYVLEIMSAAINKGYPDLDKLVTYALKVIKDPCFVSIHSCAIEIISAAIDKGYKLDKLADYTLKAIEDSSPSVRLPAVEVISVILDKGYQNLDKLIAYALKTKENSPSEVRSFVLKVTKAALDDGYEVDKLVDYALKAIEDPSFELKHFALEVMSAAINKGYQDLDKLVVYALKVIRHWSPVIRESMLNVIKVALDNGYEVDKLVDYALKAIGDPSNYVKSSALELMGLSLDRGYQDLDKLVVYALRALEDTSRYVKSFALELMSVAINKGYQDLDKLVVYALKVIEDPDLGIIHFLALEIISAALDKGYKVDKLIAYALKAIGDPSSYVKSSALELMSVAINKGYQDLDKLVSYALKAAEDLSPDVKLSMLKVISAALDKGYKVDKLIAYALKAIGDPSPFTKFSGIEILRVAIDKGYNIIKNLKGRNDISRKVLALISEIQLKAKLEFKSHPLKFTLPEWLTFKLPVASARPLMGKEGIEAFIRTLIETIVKEDKQESYIARQKLLQFGKEAILVLIAELGNPTVGKSQELIDILREFSVGGKYVEKVDEGEIISAIIEGLKDPELESPENLIAALLAFGVPAAIKVCAVLSAGDSKFTNVFIEALARLGENNKLGKVTAKTITILHKEFTSADFEVRLNAIKAAGRIGRNYPLGENLLNDLLNLAKDYQEFGSSEAIRAFGLIRDIRTLGVIKDYLDKEAEIIGAQDRAGSLAERLLIFNARVTLYQALSGIKDDERAHELALAVREGLKKDIEENVKEFRNPQEIKKLRDQIKSLIASAETGRVAQDMFGLKIGDCTYLNPFFVASIPPTAIIKKIKEFFNQGAAAVVLKTACDVTWQEAEKRRKNNVKRERPGSVSISVGKVHYSSGSTPTEAPYLLRQIAMLRLAFRKGEISREDLSKIIFSISSEEIEEEARVVRMNMKAYKRLLKPIISFANRFKIPVNVEVNMRYPMEALEKKLGEKELKEIENRKVQSVEDLIKRASKAPKNIGAYFFGSDRSTVIVRNFIEELAKLNNNLNQGRDYKVKLIPKFPFRSDLKLLARKCAECAERYHSYSAITLINTMKVSLEEKEFEIPDYGVFLEDAKSVQAAGECLEVFRRSAIKYVNLEINADKMRLPILASGGVCMELNKINTQQAREEITAGETRKIIGGNKLALPGSPDDLIMGIILRDILGFTEAETASIRNIIYDERVSRFIKQAAQRDLDEAWRILRQDGNEALRGIVFTQMAFSGIMGAFNDGS